MYVKNINKNSYKKLLTYAFKECNYFSVSKYDNEHSKYSDEILNVITKKFSKEYIVNNYSESLLNDIYSEFKNNREIYILFLKRRKYELEYEYSIKKKSSDEKLIKFFKENLKTVSDELDSFNSKKKKCINDKDEIDGIIKWLIYEHFSNIFIKKYEKYLEFTSENVFISNISGTKCKNITYKYELNEETKKMIEKIYIYDWVWPNTLEDLFLYKDDISWLEYNSIDGKLWINCNNYEYNYLTSIGIDFYGDEMQI